MCMCVCVHALGGLFTLVAAATAGASQWINLLLLSKHSPRAKLDLHHQKIHYWWSLLPPLSTSDHIKNAKPIEDQHLTPKSQKEVSMSIKDKENLSRLVDVCSEQKHTPVISVYLWLCSAVLTGSPDISGGYIRSSFP